MPVKDLGMESLPSAERQSAQFHQLAPENPASSARELIEGLCESAARIDPKFFYDRLGSFLFAAITQTPEYYPTRSEAAIFKTYMRDIASHVGKVEALIDLGAADCVKGEALFKALKPTQYVPVDISVDYLHDAVSRLTRTYPALDIVALGMDFSDRLVLPPQVTDHARLFFYPGSSIGNLSPETALPLLQGLHAACADDGGVLIGVDRQKDPKTLVSAYDDALGITAAFNLNALRHANSIIGSDFDVSDWRHVALYDESRSRIEMHLEARRDVTVKLPAASRTFSAGERIHTECSYKYTPESFKTLLEKAGFGRIKHWTDVNDHFSIFSARA